MLLSHNQTLSFVMKTIPQTDQKDVYATRSKFAVMPSPPLKNQNQNRLFSTTNSTTFVLKTPLPAINHALAGLAMSMKLIDMVATSPSNIINCIDLHAIILQVILQRKFKKQSRRSVAANQSIIQHVYCTNPDHQQDEFDQYYEQILIYLPTANCFLTHMPLPPLAASWLRLHDANWTVAADSFIKKVTQVFTICRSNRHKKIKNSLGRPRTQFSPRSTVHPTQQISRQ
jgi:hypothetical protein